MYNIHVCLEPRPTGHCTVHIYLRARRYCYLVYNRIFICSWISCTIVRNIPSIIWPCRYVERKASALSLNVQPTNYSSNVQAYAAEICGRCTDRHNVTRPLSPGLDYFIWTFFGGLRSGGPIFPEILVPIFPEILVPQTVIPGGPKPQWQYKTEM